MKIKGIMKRKTINGDASIRTKSEASFIKEDISSIQEEKTLMSNKNGSTETLVDLADNQTNSQSKFDEFKAQMLKMFEEQEKKHNEKVESLLQKIEVLTVENRQYQAKVNELEKKLNKIESNTDMVSKVQDLEQKVENLEDQYQEQSQSISQRELSDDQIVQAIDQITQNNRDFKKLQEKIDQLEKSDAKILEDQSFMTKEVEKLNSFVINNEEIKVYVDVRGGINFSVIATSAQTIGNLKSQIKEELGCDVASEILTYNGYVLEDEFNLHDYNICEGNEGIITF
ncbi:hypothetical protein BCR36DRAFT_288797 [Piromyces finnis]|uniref:Ubiquitin-like domain-containing protein n=1 Tax=Piromyces finnis TaxID=1754191 RepID=A0A1Y1VAB4_9FUNG|nr:hypothetical protein BCR36DRAFT_288797 [Piromyces finnis]|eukprot:ORX51115.1 hypothetical protein BCR36DRAFT_288797 [Piromyces finnis]